jgi:hypothetical protein
MKSIKNTIEKIFSAVAFAEADDRTTALQMMDAKPVNLLQSVQNTFAAVAFAEADLRDEALAMVDAKAPRRKPAAEGSFLDAVGLGNIPANYVHYYVTAGA